MSKKNIILCFSSLRPSNYQVDKLDSRESNYKLALEWLLKALPENWDIIYNDNTLEDLDELKNGELRNRLIGMNTMLHKSNHGASNKGAGEHDMCKKSFLTINPEEYNWVTYFTARHIISNSLYFDRLEKECEEYDCIMSNPDFDFLSDYKHLISAPNMYNDMLFSMKSNVFKNFVESIDVEYLKSKNKNSENHLFEFVKNNNYKTLELESLGILRNDPTLGWHLV